MFALTMKTLVWGCIHVFMYMQCIQVCVYVCVEAGCQFGCPLSLYPPYLGGQVLSMKLELTDLDSV